MNDIDNVTLTVAELEVWIAGEGAELPELNSSLDNALSLVRDRQVPLSFTITIIP